MTCALNFTDLGMAGQSVPNTTLADKSFQVGKVLEQPARHEPGHVDVDVRLVCGQKGTDVVPEAAPAMGHDHGQVRKIHGHIIQVNRIAVLEPRARHDRAADVQQHRHDARSDTARRSGKAAHRSDSRTDTTGKA